MYAPISEEDSFLPAILWSNPSKQLEHVRSYYERQRQLNLVLDRNLEDIRMAYSRKLCTERNRLSKSLWEIEVRKRKLLHQILEPQAKREATWRKQSIAGPKKHRIRHKESEEENKLRKGYNKHGKHTSNEHQNRQQERTGKEKPKDKESSGGESEQLVLPKFLLR